MDNPIQKCCVEVERGGSRVSGISYYSRCARKAIIEQGGKWYCWQHAPSKCAEREQLSQDHRDARAYNKRLHRLNKGW